MTVLSNQITNTFLNYKPVAVCFVGCNAALKYLNKRKTKDLISGDEIKPYFSASLGIFKESTYSDLPHNSST